LRITKGIPGLDNPLVYPFIPIQLVQPLGNSSQTPPFFQYYLVILLVKVTKSII
jgi:hypothetical protein